MGTVVGIERIGVYPTSLSLSMDTLCAARGRDRAYVRDTYLMDERAVNAPWEDPVTMAVNAAAPMLTAADRDTIGLLIVASESSVDQEKALSTWVHRHLGLPSRCRNFEVKHACYGATAGVQTALDWVSCPWNAGRKALVINTDHAMSAIGQDWETVVGTGAAAVLVSDNPTLLPVEVGRSGIYTHENSDVMRPLPTLETGNTELSLHAYFEALHGAWADYEARTGARFLEEFNWNLYHVPLGGMAWRAHRALCLATSDMSPAQARADFDRRVAPSLRFNRRTGGVYGASTFYALLGLLTGAPVRDGDRVGIFAYGAGACAELWTGRVGPRSREVADAARVEAQLDARLALSVDEYEYAERTREGAIGAREWQAPLDGLRGWYETAYRGQGRLILQGIHDWVRSYTWS